MFIIYNRDGSIKKKNFAEFIQKGNDGANKIFVAVDGLDLSLYSCYATFKLPNDELGGPVAGTIKQNFVDFDLDKPYNGYEIPITAEMTQYKGNVEMSLYIEDSEDNVMYTYPVTLVINDATSAPSQTKINLSQYQALLDYINSKPIASGSNALFEVVDDITQVDLNLYSVGKLFYDKKTATYYIKSESGYEYYTKIPLPVIEIGGNELYSMKYGQFKEKFKNAFDSIGICRCVIITGGQMFVGEIGKRPGFQENYAHLFTAEGYFQQFFGFNDNTQMFAIVSSSNRLRKAIKCVSNSDSTTLKAINQPTDKDPVFLTLGGIEFIVRQPDAAINRYLFLGQSSTGVIKSFVKEGTFTNFTTQEIIDAFNNAPEIILNLSNQNIGGTKTFNGKIKIGYTISDSDDAVSKNYVDTVVSGAVHFKGTVADLTALNAIENPAQGDMYWVTSESSYYIWNGSSWSQTGGTVDLSNYVDKTSSQTIVGSKTFTSALNLTSILSGTLRITPPSFLGASPKISFIDSSSLERGTIAFLDGAKTIQVNGDFLTDQTYPGNLGSSSIKWKDLYLSNEITIAPDSTNKLVFKADANGNAEISKMTNNNQNSAIYLLNGSVAIGGDLIRNPTGSPNRDIGSSDYKWRNLYLYGLLKDGSNEVAIADIVTKEGGTNANPQRIGGDHQFDTGLKIGARVTGQENNYLRIHGSGNGQYQIVNNYSSNDYTILSISTNVLTLGVNVFPDTTNTRDLGDTDHRWKDLWLSGNLYIPSIGTFQNPINSGYFNEIKVDYVTFKSEPPNGFIIRSYAGSLGIRLQNDALQQPTSTSPMDLGTQSNPWKDLHLSGDIYLGGSIHSSAGTSSMVLSITADANQSVPGEYIVSQADISKIYAHTGPFNLRFTDGNSLILTPCTGGVDSSPDYGWIKYLPVVRNGVLEVWGTKFSGALASGEYFGQTKVLERYTLTPAS